MRKTISNLCSFFSIALAQHLSPLTTEKYLLERVNARMADVFINLPMLVASRLCGKAVIEEEDASCECSHVSHGVSRASVCSSLLDSPSLFGLASKTRLDIESFIFLLAIGGIASVLYEALLGGELQKVNRGKLHDRRQSLHLASILSTPIIFLLLLGLTRLNPIYSISLALLVGGIAATLCRPDLTKNTWVGGLLFAGLYFVFFFMATLAFPSFVDSWNLSVLSGILIFNVPLEEIMFAFTFGMLWSNGYEHILGYRLTRKFISYSQATKIPARMVGLPGFEPGSRTPEAHSLDQASRQPLSRLGIKVSCDKHGI